ncbi:glycoside hydrolase family 15 [Candidatus Woesearchaeota archaeon]|nr:glycoside hydrolase family 15 [Candidatus Woesearchaeota archaeon]
MRKIIQILQRMQHKTGLFSAAARDVKTGYNKAWIRDNVYAALGLEAARNKKATIKTYRALLQIFLKHEYKIDWMIKQPHPKASFRYIHARYDPATMGEIYEEWGNKQNDAIGAVLFKIGDLEKKGFKIIRNDSDKRILQKLVDYLAAIEYWQDKDNGIWEENEEIHASSVGACVAGLKMISSIVDVPQQLIKKGQLALNTLLPRESETKETDLALLSLIYPYDVADKKQKREILENIEKKLVRKKGAIRYIGDKYYSNGKEAEWTFAFPWLAIIYKQLNCPEKYAHYMKKAYQSMNKKGEMPELYYSGTNKHNENTPLAWGQAMVIVAGENNS